MSAIGDLRSKELGLLRICGAVPVLRVADVEQKIFNCAVVLNSGCLSGSYPRLFCLTTGNSMRIDGLWVADEELADSSAQKALYNILETPISLELLRPERGEITQKSEGVIGPFELADFYLYPFIRFGVRPGKILYQKVLRQPV